jgi:hypothetical protein
LLPALQAADIATIAIREGSSTLTLQRRDAAWTIVERAGFPADLEQVRRLVLAVLGLKVGQTEAIGDKDRARLKLDGSGTQLEFRGADGRRWRRSSSARSTSSASRAIPSARRGTGASCSCRSRRAP